MGRLIEADDLLASLRESRDRANVWMSDCREYGSNMTERAEQAVMTFNECILRVKGAPTVDAVPVKHGRWIKKRYWSEGVGMGERYGYYYSCSKCGNLVRGGYDECGKKYCDECGARMDGEDGEHHD